MENKYLEQEKEWALLVNSEVMKRYFKKHSFESTIVLIHELSRYVYGELEKPNKKINAEDEYKKLKKQIDEMYEKICGSEPTYDN